MSRLNQSQIKALINEKRPLKKSDGDGLYFHIPKSGSPYWATFYYRNGKRRECTIGPYPEISLADARQRNFDNQKLLVTDTDPVEYKQKKKKEVSIKNVDALFQNWFERNIAHTRKNPNIELSLYRNHIGPQIGKLAPKDVSAFHVDELINIILDKGHPAAAEKALIQIKRLFKYAVSYRVIDNDPTYGLTFSSYLAKKETNNARFLLEHEIEAVFKVMRENLHTFVRENYLACCLYLVLGVRNNELLQAQWQEFDLDNRIWSLPSTRSKNKKPIRIPLPLQTIPWLNELKVRAGGSDFVFPARGTGKNPCLNSGTVLSAIKQLMGTDPRKPSENKLPGIEPFVIHDLRRTFRTHLSILGVNERVAELCINHSANETSSSLGGGTAGGFLSVEAIYNRYDYFEERKEAHQKLADHFIKYL